MADARFSPSLSGSNRVVAPGTPEHDAITRREFPALYKRMKRLQGQSVAEPENVNQRLTSAWDRSRQICIADPTIMQLRELLASLDADTRRFVIERLVEELTEND